VFWDPHRPPRRQRSDVAGGAESLATAPAVLILRMARVSPKVQLVALVGSG